MQKSISNLWLVFTSFKRNPAEQIPPETADLCRLQGHVKKHLHAEFSSVRATEEGCLFLKPVPRLKIPTQFQRETNVYRGVYKVLIGEACQRKSRHKPHRSLETYECFTTLFLSPEVTHLLHVTSALHTGVNLGPMTHDSCFPEHSTNIARKPVVFFFLPP